MILALRRLRAKDREEFRMAHIHFTQIMINSTTTHLMSSWRDPRDQQAQGLSSPAFWKKLAQTLEKGRFDGIFFADVLAVPDDFAEGAKTVIARGGTFPRQDPFALVPLMADVTDHLGFALTLSTAGTPPHLAVRRLATLDNLSGGRIGWNVVTSMVGSDFSALGMDQPGHNIRYEMADEYMKICYLLWDAFPHDALKLEKESGIAVDLNKIKHVDYSGHYYSCKTYPVASCSPQGRPLIFQAGQSERGMEFAARHAEAIYSLQARVETMQKFVSQVEAAARLAGAPRPRVMFGIQPFLGGTEEQARRRFEDLRESVPIDAALNRLSGMIGANLGARDLDKPLEAFETQASRGLLAATVESMEGRQPTVREAAIHWGMAVGMAQCVGTPEQIADWIEDLWRKTNCHGFGISGNIMPLSANEFVDNVVPILQKRGLMRTEYTGATFRENLLN
jgi:long-chain alkane monooxygenase